MPPKIKSKPKAAILISKTLLQQWKLPSPSAEGSKDMRGKILVIAGTEGMPGAAILSATAALRAGSGKLQVATAKCVAPWVALGIPEAMVVGLKESRRGVIAPESAKKILDLLLDSDAVVIGPGMNGGKSVGKLVKRLLPRLKIPLVLDAEALMSITDGNSGILPLSKKLKGKIIITPHAGEMAKILNIPRSKVERDAEKIAREFSQATGIVTVLKGRETFIAAPDGKIYKNKMGNVGLATSGSGDTLSGVIGGLLSRGAEIMQACVWGVYLHAAAGDELAKKIGPLGYLAHELLDEIPRLMVKQTR